MSLLEEVEVIAQEAGTAIMSIYARDFSVLEKEDKSPLTEADAAAHEVIIRRLEKLLPSLPILSEEAVGDFTGVDSSGRYWLVDPLDGTKEFIKRNGEFTVNIALIENGRSILGVVYAPAINVTYLAAEGLGAFKVGTDGIRVPIYVAEHFEGSTWRVVGSRSHAGDSLTGFLQRLGSHELTSIGSSLKFCLVAEGNADVYPRMGPTSLWDTAAAQCVVEQAGGRVIQLTGEPLSYADPSAVLNPFFMVHGGAKVIHINFKSAQVDNVYFPQLEVVGDTATSLQRIANRVGKSEGHDFSYFMKVRSYVMDHINEGKDDPSFPMKPQRFVADVRKAMPEDGIIALDNGVYKVWFARNYRTWRPNTVLLDNALATMGAGLPSAMEAARLFPERKVMAVCGDGGFMMNCQELETAVRLKLNLVVLILNDNSYGMIRWKQYAMGLQDFGLEFNNPDFVMFANSFGAFGHRVENAESFVPLIKNCFDEGGVHVIELPVDYSENNKVLIDELKSRVCII